MDDAKFRARVKEIRLDILFIYQSNDYQLPMNVTLFIVLYEERDTLFCLFCF